MPWYDDIFSDFGWQIEGRGIDDWLSQGLYVGMTDQSWDNLDLYERLIYEGLSREGRTNDDSPVVIFDPDTGLPIYDPSSGIIWERTVPATDDSSSGGGTSGGGVSGGGGGTTSGGSGGGVRQIAPGVFIPENMGLIQALTQGLITRELFEQLSPRLQSISPTNSPEASTDAGGGGPRMSPIEQQIMQTEALETSTDTGGGPRYTGQFDFNYTTPSVETSTDAGGGGPRYGGDNGGNNPGTTPGTGPGNGGDNVGDDYYTDWLEIFGGVDELDVDGLPRWKDYFKDAIGTFTDPTITRALLGAEGAYAPKYIDQKNQNIANSQAGYLPLAQDAIGAISDADIAADERARTSGANFFQQQYGDVIGGMQSGNQDLYSMLDSQMDQANALGDSAMDIIANAGKLNARERNSVLQGTLGGLVNRGRDLDNLGIYEEIGNVIEAERLDRNQDLGVAAGLLGAQSNIAGTRAGIEQPYVQDVFGLNQDPYPGLTIAESSKQMGSNVGPTMFDVGSLYGIATGDRNLAANAMFAEREADAQRRANRIDLGTKLWDMLGGSESLINLIKG